MMNTQPITRPALRYHGAKFRIAPWIIAHFPPHDTYVEPFGGAAGVLLQKPRAYDEIYNDLDGDIVNFFRVLRDPIQRDQLQQDCALTPYARSEFELAYEHTDDPVERARRTAIRAAMGFGSAGATKGSTGFRVDTRRKYGTAAHNWADYPAVIQSFGQRLYHVIIENRPAVDVIQQHDAQTTLHYIDPPYLHSTRVLRSQGGYRHEMTDQQHSDLLDLLDTLHGMVVLSGYASELYDARLAHWTRSTTSARISAGRGTATREEVVWLNPACSRELDRMHGGLFDIASNEQ